MRFQVRYLELLVTTALARGKVFNCPTQLTFISMMMMMMKVKAMICFIQGVAGALVKAVEMDSKEKGEEVDDLLINVSLSEVITIMLMKNWQRSHLSHQVLMAVATSRATGRILNKHGWEV